MHVPAHVKASSASRGREHWGQLATKGEFSPMKLHVMSLSLSVRAGLGHHAFSTSFPSENVQPAVELAQKRSAMSCCSFSLLLHSLKSGDRYQ